MKTIRAYVWPFTFMLLLGLSLTGCGGSSSSEAPPEDRQVSDTDDTLTDDDDDIGADIDFDLDGLSQSKEALLGTSDRLADTDGDGLSDSEEVNNGGFNPLVADLASIQIDVIGAPTIQLDVKSTDTGAIQGSYTQAFERGENNSFSRSDATALEASAQASLKIYAEMEAKASLKDFGGSAKTGFEANVSGSMTKSDATTVKEESGISARDKFSQYQQDSAGFTNVTESGSLTVTLAITNISDRTIELSQVEIIAKKRLGNGNSFQPVATLRFEPEGGSKTLGIGESIQKLVVSNAPSIPMLKDLLANPNGMVFNVANYKLVDRENQDFADISQDVSSQTAQLVIDYGATSTAPDQRSVESYMVATNVNRDAGTDKVLGISLKDVLTKTLEIPYTVSMQDIYDKDGNLTQETRQILSAVRGKSTVSVKEGFWYAFGSSQSLDNPKVNFEDIVLMPRDRITLVYLSDFDEDGLFDREEYLYGTLANNEETDGDGLTDSEETRDGWLIDITGASKIKKVYPDPTQYDSDSDKLNDFEERECALNPRLADSDGDGLTDWEELTGNKILDNGNIISMEFKNSSGNKEAISPYSGCKDGSTSAGTCSDGLVEHISLESCNLELDQTGFATDPRNPDTDGDRIPDGKELTLSANPNDPADGVAFLDDDQDGLYNQDETDGFLAIVNRKEVRLYSDPNKADTDDDGLPDLLEHMLRSDPKEPDTDGDSLPDAEEYKGVDTCITIDSKDEPCVLFGDLTHNNHADFVERCNDAAACVYYESLFSDNHGTSLTDGNSDRDSLADQVEIYGVRTITVNGQSRTLGSQNPATPEHTYSNPLKKDTDGDGWNDYKEFKEKSNPRAADTDGDGKPDSQEPSLGRSPNQKDARITVTYTKFYTGGGTCDSGKGDFFWAMYETHAGQTTTISRSNRDTDTGKTIPINQSSKFILNYGETYKLHGYFEERDDGRRDKGFDWDEVVTLDQNTADGRDFMWNRQFNCAKHWQVHATVIKE